MVREFSLVYSSDRLNAGKIAVVCMTKDFKNADSQGKLSDYVHRTFLEKDRSLDSVREKAEKRGLPNIHVGRMDGRHLEILTRLVSAKRAVEIGTLAGYSGICIARNLASDGKLYTFECDRNHADSARESFQAAGISDRVEIHVGPALKNLPKIEEHGPFDLVFIDADKENYPNYLDWAAKHLRVGGAVIGDNTFAFGMIADQTLDDEEDERTVQALRKFNAAAAFGGRFLGTIFPTGEGLTVAVKVR